MDGKAKHHGLAAINKGGHSNAGLGLKKLGRHLHDRHKASSYVIWAHVPIGRHQLWIGPDHAASFDKSGLPGGGACFLEMVHMPWDLC